MAAAALSFENSRSHLSHLIAETVNSWPDLQRRIFVSVHYCGRSAAETAASFGLTEGEVGAALRFCQRQLFLALKPLREAETSEMTCGQRHVLLHSAACCFH